MNPDFIGFFQDRISTAYKEQIWAVALVGSMNAFVVTQAKLLLECFDYWPVVLSVSFVSLLAVFFVWSRHSIYLYYDKCIKEKLPEVKNLNDSLCSFEWILTFCRFLVRWSGVTLYTLIIVGMVVTAVRVFSLLK